MSKKKRKNLTVGECQSIIDNLKNQLTNSVRLLDKSKSIIRERDLSILNLSTAVLKLKMEKTLLFKIQKWFDEKWKR